MMDSPLHWQAVSFSIRHGFWLSRKTLVENIDFQVPAGKVVGLVGPNGAGKTTTLKLGAGLLQPDKGQVLIDGRPSLEAEARTKIGILTETQYVYQHLKLREWLIMLGRLSGLNGKKLKERTDEVLSLLELNRIENQMMRTMSKGQLQRAGLAQALVHEPAILLLDEPMSGMDPYWRFRMHGIIRDFNANGGTVLFSSHILSDVERLCSEIVLITEGQVRWQGNMQDLTHSIQTYEFICRAKEKAAFDHFPTIMNLSLLPTGEWSITIPESEKDKFIRYAADDANISIESVRPIRPSIEEFLFGSPGEVSNIQDKRRHEL